VKGQNIARFLTEDLTVVKEMKSDDLEKAVETVDSSVSGLVVDRTVDQKLLDQLAVKGFTYIAAKDFRGIIKRPSSIRLMKMGS
jgi:DNA primase